MLDHIPEEILIEILLKLPVKSLIPVLSVCKAWQSLIKSPLFESLYLSNTEKQLLVGTYNVANSRHHYSLITKGEEPLSIKSIDFPFDCPIGTSCIIKGSCNGLLCLCIQSLGYSNRPPTHLNVTIWNPCTRTRVFMPLPLTHSCVVHQVLLGFGVASNVYKVVRAVYSISQIPNLLNPIYGTRAQIFTLGVEKTTWRELDLAVNVRPNHEYCWFFKGFMHWIVFESTNVFNYRNSILTFDVGNEVFGEIKLPKEINRPTVETLAIIGESFGLVDFIREADGLSFDVWIMKDYGVRESWTKLYRIDGRIDGIGMTSIVGFLESSKLLIHMDDFGLVIYNAKTKESKHVGNFGHNRCLSYVDEFKESFLEDLLVRCESDLGATSTLVE